MNSYKLPKSERLTNKKKFENLFESGAMVKSFPLKFIYLIEEAESSTPPIQVAFTVPKRSFRKAVDRNYLKRRMREAYRLNKSMIHKNIDLENNLLYGIFIYTNREKQDFHAVEKAMKKILVKIV